MRVKLVFLGDMRRIAGAGQKEIELCGPARVAEVARAAGMPDPAGLLVVVNGEAAAADAEVNDGDEIAFFPRIAGGRA